MKTGLLSLVVIGVMGLALPLAAQSSTLVSMALPAAHTSVPPTEITHADLPHAAGEAFHFPDTEREVANSRVFYRWSQVAVFAANATDTASSWQQSEANPLLAKSGASFGAGSLAIKAGLLGGTFVIQRWALHHNPKLYKTFGWMNVAIAGGLGAATAHNMVIR